MSGERLQDHWSSGLVFESHHDHIQSLCADLCATEFGRVPGEVEMTSTVFSPDEMLCFVNLLKIWSKDIFDVNFGRLSPCSLKATSLLRNQQKL